MSFSCVRLSKGEGGNHQTTRTVRRDDGRQDLVTSATTAVVTSKCCEALGTERRLAVHTAAQRPNPYLCRQVGTAD